MAFMKRVLLRTFVAPWHCARARRALARSDLAAARAHLARALVIAPDAYTAHLLLGIAGLFEGAATESLREFGICHRLNPRRFEAARLPHSIKEKVVLQEEIGDDPAFDFGADADPPDLRASAPEADPVLARTDFSSEDECLKFRNLPPITESERENIDWDSILRRLQEHR